MIRLFWLVLFWSVFSKMPIFIKRKSFFESVGEQQIMGRALVLTKDIGFLCQNIPDSDPRNPQALSRASIICLLFVSPRSYMTHMCFCFLLAFNHLTCAVLFVP